MSEALIRASARSKHSPLMPNRPCRYGSTGEDVKVPAWSGTYHAWKDLVHDSDPGMAREMAETYGETSPSKPTWT